MEKRTNLYAAGDDAGIDALERSFAEKKRHHKDWCCTADLMAKTAHGMDTIYMHPRLQTSTVFLASTARLLMRSLITIATVFKEASYKPYAIAAMIFLRRQRILLLPKALEQGIPALVPGVISFTYLKGGHAMTRIGCIVMASGASRRFGSNKLMAELDGAPLSGALLKRLKPRA